MSVLRDVAEAVKLQLNETDFGIAFQAERVRGKQHKTLEQLKELVVEVVQVNPLGIILASRYVKGYLPSCDIFLRKKMSAQHQEIATGAIDDEELAEIETLAEAMAESFMPSDSNPGGNLTHYENASWKESKMMSGFVNDQFAKTRIMQAQIRLTFDI